MNKKQATGIGLLVALLAGAVGATQIQQPCISPQEITHPVGKVSGYSFKIITPDSDFCVIDRVVLSAGNYSNMQNNVGVFTVLQKTPVVAEPTHTYCNLAKWIYDSHTDTYPDIQSKFKDKMIPPWCSGELADSVSLSETLGISSDKEVEYIPIPEFGTIATFILVVAIISIIVITVKTTRF